MLCDFEYNGDRACIHAHDVCEPRSLSDEVLSARLALHDPPAPVDEAVLDAVTDAAAALTRANEVVYMAVLAARQAGASWQQVGVLLGEPPASLQKRFTKSNEFKYLWSANPELRMPNFWQ